MDYLANHGGVITDAVSSQPWSGDAAVHVSIVNWTKNPLTPPSSRVLWLNGTDLRLPLDHIPSSLVPGIDVGAATALAANQRPKLCFQGQTPGVTKGFVIDSTTRSTLLSSGAAAGAYIHPFLGGHELLHDLEIDRWVIDVPHRDALDAQHAAPGLMNYLRTTVLPAREEAAQREAMQNAQRLAGVSKRSGPRHHAGFLATWWMHSYRRSEMVAAIEALPRYIATSRVASEQRFTVFDFVESRVRPGDSVVALALDDIYSLGVVQSYAHRLWFERRCSSLKADLRYTSSTVWDSFPWPQTPTQMQVADVECVTADLLELRKSNLARGMSLASQYDTLRHPGASRLRTLHADLDAVVLAAFGFSASEDLLAQLFALNRDLAEVGTARGPGRPVLALK